MARTQALPHTIIYRLPADTGPSGGVKVMVEHVVLLREQGIDAAIALQARESWPYPWLDRDVPWVRFEPGVWFGFRSGCWIVHQENGWAGLTAMAPMAGLRQAMFVQGHHYLVPDFGARVRRFGVQQVFTCSSVISDALAQTHATIGCPVVHNHIDHTQFCPGAAQPLRIAYMPRKRTDAVPWLIEQLEAQTPGALVGVDWVPIDGMTPDQVAHTLRSAGIFISLAGKEGFGLPALEAMASGCLVLGFLGEGGAVYGRPNNGLWCPDGDGPALAAALIQALNGHRTGADWAVAMRQAGIETAAQYTRARTTQDLLALWQPLLAG